MKYAHGVRLDGIHHVTCITADAPRNVEYYTGVLGLRLVKKSVNQDDPTVYHLFYADENGTPGSDITFFEYPSAHEGRAGAGMIHTVVWRVGSEEALEFWRERVGSVPFTDPDGLRHDLVVASVPDAPLIADHPEIPREMALQGFEGVRAYGEEPTAFLEALGFEDGLTRGESRQGWIRVRAGARRARDRRLRHRPPRRVGVRAGRAGGVARARSGGGRPSDAGDRPLLVPLDLLPRADRRAVRDRDEGPGFAADEDPAHLGETLILPPNFEHLRSQVEPLLTPLPKTR